MRVEIPIAWPACLAVLVASFCVGCATQKADRASQDKEATEEAPVEERTDRDEPAGGPFEVAQQWTDAYDEHDLSGEVGELVEQWPAATLARVWASGDEYRAVVTSRSGGEEAPAVLLHIVPRSDGAWRVADVEPSTAKHLWPTL